MKLAGQVAVVAGAGRGIGKAIALRFAAEGAKVVLASRTATELEALAGQIRAAGGEALAVPTDATNEADVERLVAKAIKAYGKVDIMVANAGMAYYKSLAETSVEEYNAMMNTNMLTTFLAARKVVPHMIERRKGMLLIVSSMAGQRGFPNEAVYCASKHAQVGFSHALDKELREYNIKVAALCPGGVNTTFAIGTGRTDGDPRIAAMLEADTVAEAALLMCSMPEKARIMEIWMRPMSEGLE